MAVVSQMLERPFTTEDISGGAKLMYDAFVELPGQVLDAVNRVFFKLTGISDFIILELIDFFLLPSKKIW